MLLLKQLSQESQSQLIINYLTAETCEVSTTWSQKPGASLRHYDEVRTICALRLLTPGR